jgi:hypothetical protein
MTYAISLYDALTGINVPKQQALAVVEALEQKMTSELATKSDIERLELATKADFAAVRAEMASEFAAVRAEMAAEFAAVRAEMAAGLAAVRGEMATEFQRRENRLLLRLGGLIVTCTTVIISIMQIG